MIIRVDTGHRHRVEAFPDALIPFSLNNSSLVSSGIMS